MSTELDERALEQLRDELQHVEDELHQIEGEAHSAHSASWITLPLAGMAMVIGIVALILAVVFVRDGGGGSTTTVVPAKKATPAIPAPEAAKTVKFEPYKTPDPTLPAVPAGAVKKFRVDVFQHVTKVADDKPPTQVWSFAVNGTAYRGTGASTPWYLRRRSHQASLYLSGGIAPENTPQRHWSTSLPNGRNAIFSLATFICRLISASWLDLAPAGRRPTFSR